MRRERSVQCIELKKKWTVCMHVLHVGAVKRDSFSCVRPQNLQQQQHFQSAVRPFRCSNGSRPEVSECDARLFTTSRGRKMSNNRALTPLALVATCGLVLLAFRHTSLQSNLNELRLLNGAPQSLAPDQAIPSQQATNSQPQQQAIASQDAAKSVQIPQPKPGTRQAVKLAPTHELIDGTEVVHQVPATRRGVLLVAHGCNHGAIDFWHKHATCPQCIGLPVEVNITTEALARGYAVIAISSWDREESRCWRSGSPVLQDGQRSPDASAVKSVLSKLLPRLQLVNLPLYALGASSGVCAQIMAAQPEDLQTYFKILKEGHSPHVPKEHLVPYPPVMFVHMPRDTHTARAVASDIDVLKAQGVAVKEIKIHPSPLTPDYLHNAAPTEITAEQSKAIYTAFKQNGLLDAKDVLAADPRRSGWRKTLKQAQVPGIDSIRLEPDQSAVSELLNVLHAGHEIVSSTTSEMLDWFESLPAPPG